MTAFENCWVEIGIQVAFNSAGHRSVLLRLNWTFCCVGRHRVVPPTGRCHAMHLPHPPPPTVHSVPLLRSKAVCKVSRIHSSGRPARLQYSKIKVQWGIKLAIKRLKFFLICQCSLWRVDRREGCSTLSGRQCWMHWQKYKLTSYEHCLVETALPE